MTLPGTDTLIIEQPWHIGRHLWGASYRTTVYDERGALLATVTEREGPRLPRRVLRRIGFAGRSRYDLVLAWQGQPLLVVRKGMGKPPAQVFRPDGTPIGSVRRQGRNRFLLQDPTGQQLGLFHDVAWFSFGEVTKRDGRRVRRDVLRLPPGAPEPVRSLAIGTAVAFDVVRGIGTGETIGHWSGFVPSS
ncbi:hypothetical protein ALI22I_39895 [Saccharothrix sp. ALI-22-I]|uniref:hypothetical protein n=1 Tax=Saccharothrix sp. ALI-22-I TaxID=1933778 RepID=UPI00097C5083|nr:hypothetical protein [Saccharothrix sp. ALI-22-I]ONI82740.1 hypothetical protein ALI22I_39895 [Saccharothrix sp. ALI-22-I]